MKALFNILITLTSPLAGVYIALTSLLLLPACATTKKAERHSSVSTDSLVQQAAQRTATTTDRDRIKEIRDTSVGIAAKKVADSIPPEGLQPAKTESGRKVPRHFEKEENGLKAWVNVDTNGKITYGAESDSLTVTIKGLIRERDYLYHRFDSLAAVLEQRSHSKTETTTTNRTKKSWSGLALAAFILLLVIILWAAYKLLTKKIL